MDWDMSGVRSKYRLRIWVEDGVPFFIFLFFFLDRSVGRFLYIFFLPADCLVIKGVFSCAGSSREQRGWIPNFILYSAFFFPLLSPWKGIEI